MLCFVILYPVCCSDCATINSFGSMTQKVLGVMETVLNAQ